MRMHAHARTHRVERTTNPAPRKNQNAEENRVCVNACALRQRSTHGFLYRTNWDQHQREDNLITGTDSSADAVGLCRKAKIAFMSANMNLRSWSSNSAAFLEQVPREDRDERTGFKVLGLHWHRVDDMLAVPAPDSTSLQSATTKRAILHCIAAVYDPLGLLSSVTISAKILLQVFVLKKKGSKTKERMKEEEMEKGDCGPVKKAKARRGEARREEGEGEDGPVVYPANAFDSRLRGD